VIARSFGEIFHANCIRNGILPISLDEAEHRRLVAFCANGAQITVDLDRCAIIAEGLPELDFQIDPGVRAALLNGWDETGTILGLYASDIATFEREQAGRMPWLHDDTHIAAALSGAVPANN
jgi:3-isopropylmalate/(R)-2-methylmalate dehydratase small subunit